MDICGYLIGSNAFVQKKEHTFTLEATLHAVSRGRLFTGVPLRGTFGALLMMGKQKGEFENIFSLIIHAY